MLGRKQIIFEGEELSGLQLLVQTYAEVAASRMQRIRQSVLVNRDYMNEVDEVFNDVRSSFKALIEAIARKQRKDPSQLVFLKRNGKTVHVFISANIGLYGDIVKRSFDLFTASAKKVEGEVAIVGKVGQRMYQESGLKLPMTYFDFSDDSVDLESLSKITQYLIQYEKVLVYFGRFDNVVIQTPTTADISGTEDTSPVETAGEQYLFEPTLEEIMKFFETEIFASLLTQTVQESQLAKFASRMIYLDGATQRIKQRLTNLELYKVRFRHRQMNSKQLGAIAGMSLWR